MRSFSVLPSRHVRLLLRCWPLMLLLLGLCLCGDVASSSGGSTLTLENARLRMDISQQNGQLTALIDKQTGRNFIDPTGRSPLFAIDLLRGDTVRTITSLDADSVIAQSATTDAAKTLVMTFHYTAEYPIEVVCRFAQRPDAAEIQCGLSITGSHPFTLKAIRFPICSLPLRLGDSASDDRLLIPSMDGILLEAPETHMGRTMHAVCDYPGTASTQVMAYYDDTAGLYFIPYDGEGNRKQLGFIRQDQQLYPQLEHDPTVTACQSYTLPYQVGLGAFHGDWQAPATVYRQWAVKQHWCRTPLAQRTDIPQWLRKAPLFYTICMGWFPLPTPDTRYSDWLPAQLRGYNATFHTPVTAIVMQWEKHGLSVTPDYFPPCGGTESFQQMTKQLRDDGNNALVFLSGLKWTLQKTSKSGVKYDDREEFEAQGINSAVRDAWGKPHIAGRPTDGMGQYAWLCPAAEGTQRLMARSVRGCQDLGITAVQMDQLVGGGSPPCYSTSHGHPPGGGNWSSAAVSDLLAKLRREGKQRNPDFALMMEEPGELFIPVLDAYLSREYVENRWPREAPGVHGVPLFSFIYHDYCLGYGGDSPTISPTPLQQDVYNLATNLVDGKLPAVALWGENLPAPQLDAQQASMLHAALDLIHGPAHEYLLYGQRVATTPVKASDEPLKCWNPVTNGAAIYNMPTVLQSGWQLRDGRIGYVLANRTATAITTDVQVTGITADDHHAYTLRTWKAGDTQPQTTRHDAVLPGTVAVEVPADSAVLVEAIP